MDNGLQTLRARHRQVIESNDDRDVAKKAQTYYRRTERGQSVSPPAAVRAAIIQRLERRTMGAGSISGPCIPSLAEHYFGKILQIFAALDCPLQAEELAAMRAAFQDRVQQGFQASPYARFVFAYRPSESKPPALDCTISIVEPSLAEQYREFLKTGVDHPFGSRPDAMVMHTARAYPETIRVLDIGAGNGRNALPLARGGHTVDASEPVPALAQSLTEASESEGLRLRVLALDLFDEAAELPAERYQLIVLSEVIPHFSERELGLALPRLASLLAPTGTLLFNAFVSRNGYRPDAVAKEAAQGVWSTFFTREELEALTKPLDLALTKEEPCVAYERAHSAPGAWPPTQWYENWANGRNLFADSVAVAPIELRWLAYQPKLRSDART